MWCKLRHLMVYMLDTCIPPSLAPTVLWQATKQVCVSVWCNIWADSSRENKQLHVRLFVRPAELRDTADLGPDFLSNCSQSNRRLRKAFINICVLRLNYVFGCGESLKVTSKCMPSAFPIVYVADCKWKRIYWLEGHSPTAVCLKSPHAPFDQSPVMQGLLVPLEHHVRLTMFTPQSWEQKERRIWIHTAHETQVKTGTKGGKAGTHMHSRSQTPSQQKEQRRNSDKVWCHSLFRRPSLHYFIPEESQI